MNQPQNQTCGNCGHRAVCGFSPEQCEMVQWEPEQVRVPAPVKPTFDERMAIDERALAVLDVSRSCEDVGCDTEYQRWEDAKNPLLSPAGRELIEAAMEFDRINESPQGPDGPSIGQIYLLVRVSNRLHAALAPFKAQEPPADPIDLGYCHCPACGWEGTQDEPVKEPFPCKCGGSELVNGRYPGREDQTAVAMNRIRRERDEAVDVEIRAAQERKTADEGDKMKPCRLCAGTKQETCPVCHGKKTVPLHLMPSEYVTCPFCEGEGTVPCRKCCPEAWVKEQAHTDPSKTP